MTYIYTSIKLYYITYKYIYIYHTYIKIDNTLYIICIYAERGFTCIYIHIYISHMQQRSRAASKAARVKHVISRNGRDFLEQIDSVTEQDIFLRTKFFMGRTGTEHICKGLLNVGMERHGTKPFIPDTYEDDQGTLNMEGLLFY